MFKLNNSRHQPDHQQPDFYGIKQLSDDTGMRALVTDLNTVETVTTRQHIAGLIRSLTYRELRQIATEIEKPMLDQPEKWDIAQTLDDWAHMVKDETDPLWMPEDTEGLK
jgi:hypothetical protein